MTVVMQTKPGGKIKIMYYQEKKKKYYNTNTQARLRMEKVECHDAQSEMGL